MRGLSCALLPLTTACSCIFTAVVHAELYCDELHLGHGEEVLDIGCGWGSFTLFAVRTT